MKSNLLLSFLLVFISLPYFSCTHTIRLTDTFGDGWNGGTVTVQVNGVAVLTNVGATFTTGFGPVDFTFNANAGNTITVIETNGGGFPTEMRCEIFNSAMTSLGAAFDPATGGTNFIASCPPPMSVTSATVTQVGTGNIGRCFSDQQVIRLEVTMSAGTSVNLTQIRANLTGTAAATAFSNCDVFYTGNSTTFSTSTLFGSASPTVANFFINGSVPLVSGTNYFWICLDLNNTGTVTNTVDMACTQFTSNAINTNTTTTPAITVSNPAGSMSLINCVAPGGVNSGLETWLRADLGTTGGTPLTAWNNQCLTGTATILNGSPNLNTTNSSYNYNPYVDFTAPVGTLDGGIAANRQCIRLSGLNGINGIDYRALHFVFQLNNLSRVNTHIATVQGVTVSAPLNGTWHGDADVTNTTACILLEAYDIVDFGTGSPAGTWQRNASNILSNSPHVNTKHILSANCTTGGSTTLNAFLGGQNDQTPASSFAGHPRDWFGPAAEIIGFRNQLTVNERQRVDSYLAIKYGLTLPNNYLNTNSTIIYTTTAPYNNNIIGIGRDDTENLNQKQSHYNNDLVRLYRGTIAGNNQSNSSTFTVDNSYVVMGDNNGAHCLTLASLGEMPTGLTNCTLYSRLEKEWKVQRTNMAQTFNIDVSLAACGAPGSVSVADLRLLVDDDGNFANGGTQCYYIGDGTGINFTYTNPVISVLNINTTHIPDNSTRFITIASVNAATPLPIELLNFTAKLNENKRTIDLNWVTESEINTEYFEIEKLIDNNWEVIGSMDAKGSLNTVTSYYLEDLNPIFGDNFYRLKSIDTDGSFNYSDVRVVRIDASDDIIEVFPNPASNSIQLISKNLEKKKIQLFDATGREINVDILTNNQDNCIVNTSNLANGYYTFKVIGSNVLTTRILVQH